MKKFIIPALAAVLLTSCVNYQKTKSGLLFKIISNGKGPVAKKGDFIKLNYIQKVKDSVLGSSYSGFPVYTPVDSLGPVYNPAEIFTYLRKGDSAVVVQLGDSIDHKFGLPPFMKRSDKIILKLKVLDIFPNSDVAEKDRNAELEKTRVMQQAAFDKYMSSRKDKLQKTPGGVYVDIKVPGNGPSVDSGKYVAIRYTGKLIPDEKVFETNMDDPRKETFKFPVGQRNIIPGWDEGLKLFHQGGKGTLYIPYQMAYNQRPGPGGIPYQNLIFDIEVVEVRDIPKDTTSTLKNFNKRPLIHIDTTGRKKKR